MMVKKKVGIVTGGVSNSKMIVTSKVKGEVKGITEVIATGEAIFRMIESEQGKQQR